MKLLYIYGPPAAGKLTVAKELSKLTGYKIFHNHLTLDPVEVVLDWGSDRFFDLVNKYRLELMEAAAKEGIPGLIFTYVYGKGCDDSFVKNVIKRIKKHGGEVCFVQLYCSEAELLKRVKNPSRKSTKKIKKVKTLRRMLARYDLLSGVPHKNNLRIDNTKLSAKRAALMIQQHFGL
jgi:tRNA uridine 5-carbamoylmethylation protein Kti12